MTNSTRLANITARQKGTAARDAFFAACVALATFLSVAALM